MRAPPIAKKEKNQRIMVRNSFRIRDTGAPLFRHTYVTRRDVRHRIVVEPGLQDFARVGIQPVSEAHGRVPVDDAELTAARLKMTPKHVGRKQVHVHDPSVMHSAYDLHEILQEPSKKKKQRGEREE
jgi:hypothetical protein